MEKSGNTGLLFTSYAELSPLRPIIRQIFSVETLRAPRSNELKKRGYEHRDHGLAACPVILVQMWKQNDVSPMLFRLFSFNRSATFLTNYLTLQEPLKILRNQKYDKNVSRLD